MVTKEKLKLLDCVLKKQNNVLPLREMKFSLLTSEYNVGAGGEGRFREDWRQRQREGVEEISKLDTEITI